MNTALSSSFPLYSRSLQRCFLGKMIRRDELVDQSLLLPGLLDDVLLVVLTERTGQLVVVHLGAVLTLTPQSRQLMRVLDLEDACNVVAPVKWCKFE